ncbi:carbon storage regulator CsrA [Tepidibacter hydrothermalis]|uniref:Translational regulator CsrA n=1 Tax=Tepidibacter hydrothermalis TaxID=3036126 RepID=A0ABY8EEM5_9FIRM|nr:carbon storage regulator CsrA [Tepidibacter hydrothermalis]WFD10039.1 carbon storage regulator CsrA [Tepidibacter hydrothermalis]
MLILGRKLDESIIINENIEIKIIGISDGKVKVGIEAPKEVEILRKEVKEAVVNENKEAMAKMDINTLRNLIKK